MTDPMTDTPSPGLPAPHPADALREVPKLLLAQWEDFFATACPVLRWVLAEGEGEWVEAFLQGRQEGSTTLVTLEAAVPSGRALERHGFVLADALTPQLVAARVPKRGAFAPLALPAGLRDTDALAGVLGSYVRHVADSAMPRVAVVLAPSTWADPHAYATWLRTFLAALVRFAPGVRVVLLDDAAQPHYDGLASGAAVHTVHANLTLSARVQAMSDAAADPSTLDGRLRGWAVQALLHVRDGQLREADAVTRQLETLASEVRRDAVAVPARLALGAALTGQRRHPEAVESYRAAERAAERAEAHGDPSALRLRVLARFGVAAALLASPAGLALSAQYYTDTAPLCEKLGDQALELDAHRCAAVAHELGQARQPAFDACVKALALSDRMTPADRQRAQLVPFVDLLVRLVQHRDLAVYQAAMHAQLRRRGLRGTSWA
jgi:hypothetical protein